MEFIEDGCEGDAGSGVSATLAGLAPVAGRVVVEVIADIVLRMLIRVVLYQVNFEEDFIFQNLLLVFGRGQSKPRLGYQYSVRIRLRLERVFSYAFSA